MITKKTMAAEVREVKRNIIHDLDELNALPETQFRKGVKFGLTLALNLINITEVSKYGSNDKR